MNVFFIPQLGSQIYAMAGMQTRLQMLANAPGKFVGHNGRVKALQQGMQARDRVLDVLLERTDVPLPESAVQAEIEWREQTMREQLEQAGLTEESYLRSEGRSAEDFHGELRRGAESAVKAQLVLDAIADKEQVGVNDAELTEQVVRRAQRAGVPAEEFAQQLVNSGQLGSVFAEVRRGKALATVLESAKVTDASGRTVDLNALRDDGADEAADEVVEASE